MDKDDLVSMLRHEYAELEADADASKLTPEQITQVRMDILAQIERLNVEPLKFGKILAGIAKIIGIENVLDEIK